MKKLTAILLLLCMLVPLAAAASADSPQTAVYGVSVTATGCSATPGADGAPRLTVFLDALEAQYGVRPMIYTRSDIYEAYLAGTFDSYPYWISSLYTPIGWNYHGDWYLWQYLNRGVLEGYEGGETYIDLNVLNGDKALEQLIVR